MNSFHHQPSQLKLFYTHIIRNLTQLLEAQVRGQSFNKGIINQAVSELTILQKKLSELLVDKINPIGKKIKDLLKDEKYLELILFNGHSYIDIPEKKRKKNNPFRTTHFKEDLRRFDLSSFSTTKKSEKLYKGH